MFCRNCGREVHPQAVACPGCGVPPRLEKKFCPNCAAPTQANQALCTSCGASLAAAPSGGCDQTKLIAGLLGILLGSLGIHKFYLGYTTEGLTMLLVSLLGGFFTCGIATTVIAIIGVIEGILYLTKSDEEFTRTYVQGRKGWF